MGNDWALGGGAEDERDDAELATALQRLLEAAHSTLGMDVAYVSLLDAGRQTFTHITGDAESFGWQPGMVIKAADGYCQHVIAGEMPTAIPDTRAHPLSATLPVTALADIGAYVGVPLTLRSGRVYGALCVTSHDSRSEITAPDVAFMRLLAHMVSEELSTMEARALQRRMQRDALAGYLAPGGLRIMLQPIVNITNGRAVGVEALARFPGYSGSPSEMFSCAAAAGIGVALELAAITAALGLLEHIPDDVYLAVNASPDAVADPRLQELMSQSPGHRLVLELTEHVAFTDHAQLMTQLSGLRRSGVRIAVDDTGSGFASLQNVLAIGPDVIKLDLALVTGIDRDPVRRALARALTAFAAECGATLVAEGIETRGELETLRDLGVMLGQGYYLARPALAVDLKLDTPALAAS